MQAGTRLGPYELLNRIGSGGMGDVYRARDTRLDRTVAIKIMAGKHSTDPGAKERFKREARNISSLAHPHICTLLDVGSDADCDFLVMEYLEGETLAQRLSRGALPIDEALEIAIDVGDALDKAHRLGVVHRDLKPGNVMLTASGAKLLDFGLAKEIRPAPVETDGEAATDITDPGIVMGTTAYMSPEQTRGVQVDERSDVWSLGVVLYEMVTGRRPFAGPTKTDVMAAILLQDVPPMPELRHDVPHDLARIITKTLAKNPSMRHQTAADLVRELDRLRNELRWRESGLMPALEPGEAQFAGAGKGRGHGADDIAGPSAWADPAVLGSVALALAAVGVAAVAARAGGYGVLVSVLLLLGAAAGIAWVWLTRSDSVAVLPFGYLSVDSQIPDGQYEYLADGITESIINSMSQMPRLKVISRSSVFHYKNRRTDPRIVGRDLQVRHVLTGRILRRQDAFEISVALERTSDSKHLWGMQYEYAISDLAAVPRQIAEDTARNLRARWTRTSRSESGHHVSSEAYHEYLRGRYFWNKRTGEDIRKALQCFESALRHDSRFALAHVSIAQCYIALGVYTDVPLGEAYALAKAAVMQALVVDRNLPEAHLPLAVIKAGEEWDLPGALEEFGRAVRLLPNNATARQWHAEHLVCAGQAAAAVREARRALQLDPLSLIVNASYGMVLMQARRFGEAMVQLRKTLDMDGNFYVAHRVLRDVYLEMNMYVASIEHHRIAARLCGEAPEEAERRAAALLAAYREGGAPQYWRTRLRQSEADREGDKRLVYDSADVSPYHVAVLYARLGDTEATVRWLNRALEERDFGLYQLSTNPVFDPLHRHVQVEAIIKRLHLVS